ncbi:MAG: NADH-quinone oxidoreductase subunit L, partial [Gaiellales bacterium]
MDLSSYAWVAYLAPLAGAGVIAVTGSKLSRRTASVVACLAMLVSFIGALGALLKWTSMSAAERMHPVTSTAWTWLSSGTFRVPVQIQIDPLSIWMLLVVTGVGLLIHVYSIGYMADDPQQRRFMAYLNIFVFAMLTLVLSANLVLLLAGWGLVGMSSYLLIGFWHDRPIAVAAAKKAFIVNAIGDVGIMLGIYLIFRESGALSFRDVFASLPQHVHQNSGMAFVICLLLATGAFAKSAQLPLHTWLPDAMEGPTPVSALIHAATMVTAGVYMIARLHPIFDLSIEAQKMIFIVGGLTLLMAGFTALAQTDIKRIIAYSTMSQIGYMFVAVGIGAYNAALFHLATHALFKALLFLAAGVIIHALGDEQDVRKMGGLKKYMPKTYWLFVVASLALSGIIPFAGFFSKDEILAFDLAAGHPDGWTAYAVYGLGLVGALLTGLYSFRLIYLVFHGEESELVARYGRGEIIHHGHATNAHGEAPRTMLWPIMLLGLGTTVAGFLAVPGAWNIPEKFLRQAGAAPIRESLAKAELSTSSTWILALMSVAIGLIGIGTARLVWKTGSWSGLRTRFPGLERVFQAAFGWDRLYDNVVARPVQGIAIAARGTEEKVI